jgi:hypothetical protein
MSDYIDPNVETATCVWPHQVSNLYGVWPCAIEDLPKHCPCGEPYEYADEVTFNPAPAKHIGHFNSLTFETKGELYTGPVVKRSRG